MKNTKNKMENTMTVAHANKIIGVAWGLWFVFVLLLNVNGYPSPFAAGFCLGALFVIIAFHPLCKLLDSSFELVGMQNKVIDKLELNKRLQSKVIGVLEEKIGIKNDRSNNGIDGSKTDKVKKEKGK